MIGHFNERFRSVTVPKGTNEFSDGYGIGIVTDKAKNENSILAQVLIHEAGRHLLVALPLDLVHQTEMLSDVTVAVGAEGQAQDPGQKAEAGQGGDEHHPEPDKQVNLLVEEIDGQHALHGVTLDVS